MSIFHSTFLDTFWTLYIHIYNVQVFVFIPLSQIQVFASKYTFPAPTFPLLQQNQFPMFPPFLDPFCLFLCSIPPLFLLVYLLCTTFVHPLFLTKSLSPLSLTSLTHHHLNM